MAYLIKDTTREQRIELASDALGILLLDAPMPSAELTLMINKYIDGKMEIEDILSQLKKLYSPCETQQ